MVKIIAFDFVDTLTYGDSLYGRIHKIVGCEKEARENVERFLRGKLSERKLIQANVKLHKGVLKDVIVGEAKKVKLRKGVTNIIKELNKRGYVLALITSDLMKLHST